MRYRWTRSDQPIPGTEEANSRNYVAQPADEAPNGGPYLRSEVKACTNDDCSDWIPSWNHVLVATTGTPSNGSDVDTLGPRLSAAPIWYPIQYWFQISDSPSFGTENLLAESGWQAQGDNSLWTAFDAPPDKLVDGKTYWWRLKVRETSGNGTNWTSPSSFTVMLPKLGARDDWPIWSHGPVSVNQFNGNLVLAAPTPSYPTASGSIGFSLTYNSQESKDSGFGPGWTLVAGDELAEPPLELVDHGELDPHDPDHLEGGVDVMLPDGGSEFYANLSSAQDPSYRPPPGRTTKLTKNEDGSFTLVEEDATIYKFGAADGQSGVSRLASAETIDTGNGNGVITYGWTADRKPDWVKFKQS